MTHTYRLVFFLSSDCRILSLNKGEASVAQTMCSFGVHISPSWLVLSCLVLSCIVLSCLALSCLALFCLVLCCLVYFLSLSFLLLSCLVLC